MYAERPVQPRGLGILFMVGMLYYLTKERIRAESGSTIRVG